MSSLKQQREDGAAKPEAKGILKTTEKVGAHFPPFRVDLKFRNTLPEVPFDPHFLEIPFPKDFLWGFKQSTLEKNYKYKIHMNPPLARDDFIDPLTAEEWAKAVILDDKDKSLISKDAIDTKAARASRSVKEARTWMLRTIYTRENVHRPTTEFQLQEEEENGIENPLGEVVKDRDTRVRIIKEQFEAAKSPNTIKAPPGKKIKKIYPFLPHRQLRELALHLIRFKADEELMSDDVMVDNPAVVRRAILVERKKETDEDDEDMVMQRVKPKTLSLFLPTTDNKGPDGEDEEEEEEDDELFGDDDEDEDEDAKASKKKQKKATEAVNGDASVDAEPKAVEYVREYVVQEDSASKNPFDRLALIFEDDVVRYAELEQETMRLYRSKRDAKADRQRRHEERNIKITYKVENTEERDDVILLSAPERRAKVKRRRTIEGEDLVLQSGDSN